MNFVCLNGHRITTLPVESDGEPTRAQAEEWAKELQDHTFAAIQSGEIWSICPHCGLDLQAHRIDVLGSSFSTLEEADRVLDEGERIGTNEARAAMRRRVQ